MNASSKPLLLHVWLFLTRLLSFPLTVLARRLHRKMGAEDDRFVERLGRSKYPIDAPVIWFHAASLGEVSQLAPLVAQLSEDDRKILITTTTQSGADWVARELPHVMHQFAPMDTPRAVNTFLSAWNISIAVFVEGDFGPRITLEARQRGIPTVLLNARHSRTRDRFAKVFAVLLNGFALVTCRSDEIAKSIRALGVSEGKIRILPDLRIAAAKLPYPTERFEELRESIGARPAWLAASTHPSDEAAVLAAHGQVIDAHPDALLIWAPRHPNRGDPVATATRDEGFEVSQRSLNQPISDETQVYVADTLGELGLFYALAPLAFLGGSLGSEGGHNPFEPAAFGTAILSGAGVRNFAHAYRTLSQVGAAELVEDPASLGGRVSELLASEDLKTMGDAGRNYMQDCEDSIAETAKLLLEI